MEHFEENTETNTETAAQETAEAMNEAATLPHPETETKEAEAAHPDENRLAIEEVRKNLIWDNMGEARLSPAAEAARREEAVPAPAPKTSFWQKAGAALGKLKFWGRKEPEMNPEEEKKRAFEKAADRTAIATEGSGELLSGKEQGDILDYANSNPELKGKKSIELLARLPEFSPERKEVLVGMILESVRLPDGENLLSVMRSGKEHSDNRGRPVTFKALLEMAMKGATDNPYIENLLPLIPFGEIEEIAKKISGRGYRLATPQEYAEHQRMKAAKKG